MTAKHSLRSMILKWHCFDPAFLRNFAGFTFPMYSSASMKSYPYGSRRLWNVAKGNYKTGKEKTPSLKSYILKKVTKVNVFIFFHSPVAH